MGLFSGKTETQSERYSMDPYTQAALISEVRDRLRNPTTLYPESFRAEMDPLQTEALGMQEQYARGLGGMVAPGMEAWQSTLAAPDVANNPYVQGMLEQQRGQVMQGLQESMPALQANMLGVNERLGGTGQGVAEGIATRGAMDSLARQAAQTQFDAYQAGLGQQRYGLGVMPQMMQMGQMPANILAGVGGARRAEEQAGIDEERFRYDFAQEEPWRRIERAANIWMPLTQPYGKTTSETSSDPSTLSKIGQVAGLGATIGGMGFGGFGGMGLGGGSPFGMGPAYGALTGSTYGTNPYSMQSAMLAQQMAGF